MKKSHSPIAKKILIFSLNPTDTKQTLRKILKSIPHRTEILVIYWMNVDLSSKLGRSLTVRTVGDYANEKWAEDTYLWLKNLSEEIGHLCAPGDFKPLSSIEHNGESLWPTLKSKIFNKLVSDRTAHLLLINRILALENPDGLFLIRPGESLASTTAIKFLADKRRIPLQWVNTALTDKIRNKFIKLL